MVEKKDEGYAPLVYREGNMENVLTLRNSAIFTGTRRTFNLIKCVIEVFVPEDVVKHVVASLDGSVETIKELFRNEKLLFIFIDEFDVLHKLVQEALLWWQNKGRNVVFVINYGDRTKISNYLLDRLGNYLFLM